MRARLRTQWDNLRAHRVDIEEDESWAAAQVTSKWWESQASSSNSAKRDRDWEETEAEWYQSMEAEEAYDRDNEEEWQARPRRDRWGFYEGRRWDD